MIFVAVGTPKSDFFRLLKEIDRIAAKTDEKILVQKGNTKYEPKNCESYDFIDVEDFRNYIKKSRAVIIHAGIGTILTCLNFGKKPIIVPRRKKFNEHVDDHQIEIAEKFRERFGIPYVKNIKNLEGLIKKPSAVDNKPHRWEYKRDKSLENYLKELLENYKNQR